MICAPRASARSTMSRETCRNFALERSWENSARQFVGNLTSLQPSRILRASPAWRGGRCAADLQRLTHSENLIDG